MEYRLPEVRKPEALSWANVSRDLRGTKPGDVWYVLEAATVVRGIDAAIRATFFEPDGTINCGLMVCNLRPDGQGEFLPSEGATAQFNLGSASNFTPPALGPHAIFCAEQAEIREVETTDGRVMKYLYYHWLRSDVVSGLGNVNAEHTRIALKYRGVVLREAALPATLDDALRDEAYQRTGRGAWCNPEAALQSEARRRGLGAVLTDEFGVAWDSTAYVGQGFAGCILAVPAGRYERDAFREVLW